MGKKTKSKSRLDKYYRLAKEQGYRSRAAFKIIEINKKYNFLQKATVLIDLCAAPGGWLQIASKYMPSSSIIIGVDLDPIPRIPNCITFQEDITTQKCLDRIKKQIKHLKADVVLNDGAPNVGSSWTKDAYSQTELVMYALKLATQILRKGGTFVTKIFRSGDYHSLIWLFNKFFRKVEANKPESSRQQSAEIFVVCSDYVYPDYIDPKFFNPEFVFKESESDVMHAINNSEVNSIKKIFEKHKRKLIKDEAPLTMYTKSTLKEFINSSNPYAFFTDFNMIEILDRDFYNEMIALIKAPLDMEDNFKDMKLLNKRQVSHILKWRTKLNQQRKLQDQEDEVVSQKEEKQEENEEDLENLALKNIKKRDKQEQKAKDKSMLKFVKTKLITKDNMVENIEIEEGLENFDFTKHAKDVRNGRYIDDEEEEIERKYEAQKMEDKKRKINSFNEMSNNIEYLYDIKKTIRAKNLKPASTEIVDTIVRKNKKIKKLKTQDLKKSKLEESEKIQIEDNKEIDFKQVQENNKWFDQEIFNVINEQKTNQQETNLQEEIKTENFENNSLMEEEEIDRDYDKLQKELEKNAEIVEDIDIEKMDDDELAEILVISKKMLRKKHRRNNLDDAYNKYNYPEDPKDLPVWFYEDEKRHIGKIPQVTKEDVKLEKEQLKILKARLPKKVMEAKFRKKKKLITQMKKAKNKAEEVFENDAIGAFSKARQINQIYKKAAKSTRPKEKEIIVAKKFTMSAPRKKSGKKFAVVDSRLRSDVKKNRKTSFKRGTIKKYKRKKSKKKR